MMKLIATIILCICMAGSALASEDWAYELSPHAREIYEKRIIQIPCEKIPKLLNEKNTQDLYLAIRDAGIFKEESCRRIIQKHMDELMQLPDVKGAVSFYLLRLGDRQQLNVLAKVFDKEARATGDHWVVELFGFLDDWDVSGKRLARHSGYSDGASAEILCSAIMWRRYIYGEKTFKQKWYEVGKKEKIEKHILDLFYERCK
jgi:hypothetical protein